MAERFALLDQKVGLGSRKEGVSVAQHYLVAIFDLQSPRRCVVKMEYSELHLHNYQMHWTGSLGIHSGWEHSNRCAMQSEESGMYLQNHQMHLAEHVAGDDGMGETW